jgi:hypothetical protein
VADRINPKEQIEEFWEKVHKRNNTKFLKDYIHEHDYAELASNIPYHLFEDPDLVEESNDQPLPNVIQQFIAYITEKHNENTKRLQKISLKLKYLESISDA